MGGQLGASGPPTSPPADARASRPRGTPELEDGRIGLAFRGNVRGMRSGWSGDPVDLMPTWLAWLMARHGLSLLSGTTLYLGSGAAILL